MSYFKSLVVDIDDTISFTTKRDWENAAPNKELIEKLNSLYVDGWEIHYVTARGYLSFEKDRKKAEEHYKPIIERWLKKHNVMYTSLSFEKILASYYIDDKGINPDDFLNLEIKTLNGGLSGAVVERRGDKVYKTHTNAKTVISWFERAEKIVNVPKIYSLIGDTICMEYIPVKEFNISLTEDIFDNIETFSKIDDFAPFQTYIDRLKEHSSISDTDRYNEFIHILSNPEIIEFFDSNKSFCHGDLTIDNILNYDERPVYIDPNYISGIYSSWLLDVSKLQQSARRHKNKELFKKIQTNYTDIKKYILLLECSHWLRMRKYTDEKEYIDQMFEIVYKEYKGCLC